MSAPSQADRRRLLAEGLAVAALTVVAAWLRLDALGRLSLDGDDGFTALAVAGVLEHGVPQLPAGVVYWKSLLYTYLAAGAQLLFGPAEWALRLPDALASTALVLVGWWVARRCFGPGAALATAAVLALHLWGVEMGRHARYYALLQLMVLLFVERFHRVHVEGVGRARPTLILAFLGALLAHTIALSLAALYGPLLLADRARLLRDRGFLAECAGVAAVVVGWFAFESSWEVGFVTRPDDGALSAVGALLGGYSTALVAWWPQLSPRLVALAGGAALVAVAARLARRPLPREARMLWILALGTATILAALGFGQANHQPRYLFFTFPLVVLVAFGGLRVAVGGLASRAGRPLAWAPAAAALVALAVVAPDLRVRDAWRVPARVHATPIVHPQFQPSTTKRFSWDHAAPNAYVAEHRRPGDRVFGMHPIFTHHYAGGLDGWIWRGDPGTWDAYHDRDGRPYDNYVGVPLMRTLGGLLEQLVLEPGRVWVVATPSMVLDAHVDGRIRSFLERQPEARVVNGRDGLSGTYLWENGVGAAGPEPHPFWEIERMPGLTGRIEVDPSASRHAIRVALEGRDPAGVLSHGPYREFPAGRYEARFRLAGRAATARVEVVVATVGTPLAERDVTLDRDAYERELLPVELAEPTELELRIVWHGDGELRADRVELVPVDAAPREIRVLAAGDSITELNYPPFLEPLLDEGLEWPVVLVNGGRSGNTTREYLAHLMHGNLLGAADPDWVLLQLGTNDVRVDSDHTELEEFERNLESLLRLFALHRNGRGRAPEVLLGTVPPLHAHPRPFDADSPRRIVEEINPAIRRIAREKGLALSDPFERLGDAALFPDGIHPDDSASQVIAESWAGALLERIVEEP